MDLFDVSLARYCVALCGVACAGLPQVGLPQPAADQGTASLSPSTRRIQPGLMVRIEAGPFVLGTDDGPTDERPAHPIDVSSFEIDVYPVRTADFAAFLTETGSRNSRGQNLFDLDDSDARIRRDGAGFEPTPGYASHPVVEASWFGARDYCIWREARLPTEAEWEKAARGPSDRPYPWGWEPPDSTRARYVARFNDYVAVGSFPAGATPEGLVDMAGNVWQWVSSLYRPYPYRADDGREDPDATGERVTRGGGHDSPGSHLRTSYRGRGLSRGPTAGHHNIGFRCARDA